MTQNADNAASVKLRRDVQLSLDGTRDRPVGSVLQSVFTGTNAELMRAVAPLYLTGSVVDITYGEGKWWDCFRPEPFACHDLHKVDGVDFRCLPEADNEYATVAFDPPYTVAGGVSSAALGDRFSDRYGVGYTKVGNHDALASLMRGGIAEACRVASDWVLVKCMEFAQGNRFHDYPTLVTGWAQECGWHKHDQLVHYTGTGPGGNNIFTVKRARRAHSYLLVFAP